MKAKWIGIALLCLMAVLALLPASAMATSAEAEVYIGGELFAAGSYYVNGANGAVGTFSATEPTGGAWNAYYYEDADNGNAPTLTLKGLVLTDFAGDYCINMEKT